LPINIGHKEHKVLCTVLRIDSMTLLVHASGTSITEWFSTCRNSWKLGNKRYVSCNTLVKPFSNWELGK
jgi:hypothetical protein